MNDVLSELVRGALEHQGAHIRFSGDGGIDQVIPVEPAVVRYLSLNEVLTPKAGAQTTFNGIIAARSLVAAAGAEIIRIPGPMTQQADIDDEGNRRPLKQQEVPRHYIVVAPGKFAAVADDAEITLSGAPYLVASYDDATAPSYGIGYQLSRQQLKHEFPDDTVLRAVNSAIEQGIARLADSVLLTDLNTKAATLTDATVDAVAKAAAAKGCRWADLSAIAGTSAAGVTLGGEGTLRACAVKAELTDTIATTIVGDFSRAAVAIDDELRVTAKRINNGAVEIVVWCNAQALVPDSAYFWKYGA
ncbi:TPA: hypothetical protein HJP87_000514 [Escherichia coli]|nr:hypothetical protein [Escherichia coli]EFT2873761.1 hypothetical protein [Escherichia coli]EHH6760046.1 hypothetical protein [Escherichia coli]EIN1260852.1 hypothetical protein [Escherichia coli]EIW7345669.1 hypothetical protein [Escherichia coli]